MILNWYDWSKHRLAHVLIALVAIIFIVLRWAPHAPLSDAIGSSRAVFARGGELLRLTLAPDQQYRLWTPLSQISPTLIDAVLTYEDRHFYWHPGVNPVALGRAMVSTFTGTRRLGGSTLTMQLARRRYAIDSRTVGGKTLQICAAVWLELRYSKDDILEAYLNTAPYGGNIEGVGAASLIYFRKSALDLSWPEALTLAVVPQNPVKRLAESARAVATPAKPGRAKRASGGPNESLQAARLRLHKAWTARHPDGARAAPEAQLTLDAASRSALPFYAPHATDLLLAQQPHDREIYATIDLPTQRALERVLAQYLTARSDVGINNASALLLDASTMQVRALIGSADHGNDAIAGQVNGTQAKRSPGSTLKPFIYALALDQGLLHPRTVLKDSPTSFGAFSPENFDGRFAGPLAAQDALIRSRNVPAVALAARLHKPGLYEFMKQGGVSRLQTEQHYGLALVLGGGEVTMEELARLYAVLANGGRSQGLVYSLTGVEPPDKAPRPKAPSDRSAIQFSGSSKFSSRSARGYGMPSSNTTQPALQLLSPDAAYITLDMLRHTPRPDTGSPAQPAVAWKTGTSWGFRDAWTAGVFGRYVLVVWLGHFDSSSNPALVGINAAAPLFLRMVDALRAQQLDPGEVPAALPPDLRQVEVCTATGGLPDALCPVRSNTWFIAGKSPIQTSGLHRTVWVDERSGKAVCGPQAHARAKVVEEWGSDMQALFKQAGLPRASAPEVNCSPPETQTPSGLLASVSRAPGALTAAGTAPVIATPLRGVTYPLRASKPSSIGLRADAQAGVQTIFWFADDALVGKSAPGESLAWWPQQARTYVLRAVDDQGRAESREVTVQWLP